MRKFLLSLLIVASVHADTPQGVAWVGWSADLFDRARSEKKLVLLDLEAVWCHWCHVMDEKTYSDPRIQKLLADKFIAVRVDQDARPDLSLRYEDFGWPATILFGSDGKELAKRSGFQSADDLWELMRRKVANPVADPEATPKIYAVPDSPFLNTETRKLLQARHVEQYDNKTGGWGSGHKFLFGKTEEWALRRAWRKDAAEKKRAQTALTKALAILDPVWGGMYQYSVDGWKEPHFEKIAESQFKGLFLYSLGFSFFETPSYSSAALSSFRYLVDFLRSPEGAFYTSQDADLVPGKHSDGYFKLSDKARRKQGVPRVDKHVYSRENGWFITGLCALYAATGSEEALRAAREAAEWIGANRALSGGGFRHDTNDQGGPYLGDSLQMAQAYLALYEVTAERRWLAKAATTAKYIGRFAHSKGGKSVGFLPSQAPIASGLSAYPVRHENIDLARFSNRLFHYTGEAEFKETSIAAMRFLAIENIAREYPTGGVLLADEELTTAPVHVTVLGAKSDPTAKALFQAALRYPTSYKRVEWWDAAEGPLPHADVKYPSMKKAAAFSCSEGRCSLPVFSAIDVKPAIDKLYQ